jgi:NAD-dependent SIR2 family protein deacetylase
VPRDNVGMTPFAAPPADDSHARERLRARFTAHARWFVLTGAGCSTASGIPDYRDALGEWKRRQPVTLQAFVGDAQARARYWARSMIGWPRLAQARPNDAHRALARLEQGARLTRLVTQNVDGLHQAAGSHDVIDLHGRVTHVICLGCGARSERAELHARLHELNPAWSSFAADIATAPDGDADLDGVDFGSFRVPACAHCGGLLKPDVVFFGENVPRPRVDTALDALDRADAMLVVGSSLMVYSGYRFARRAADSGKPIVAINLGRTRADHLLAEKFELPCAQALGWLD